MRQSLGLSTGIVRGVSMVLLTFIISLVIPLTDMGKRYLKYITSKQGGLKTLSDIVLPLLFNNASW